MQLIQRSGLTSRPVRYSQLHVHFPEVDIGITFQEAAASQDILSDRAGDETRQASEENKTPFSQIHITRRRCRLSAKLRCQQIGTFGLFGTQWNKSIMAPPVKSWMVRVRAQIHPVNIGFSVIQSVSLEFLAVSTSCLNFWKRESSSKGEVSSFGPARLRGFGASGTKLCGYVFISER